jgi:hypothetical protein
MIRHESGKLSQGFVGRTTSLALLYRFLRLLVTSR